MIVPDAVQRVTLLRRAGTHALGRPPLQRIVARCAASGARDFYLTKIPARHLDNQIDEGAYLGRQQPGRRIDDMDRQRRLFERLQDDLEPSGLQQIGGELWSAIQITTAAGICAVLDLHVAGRLPRRGLVKQENVTMEEFLASRFGQYYESQKATRFSSNVMGEED